MKPDFALSLSFEGIGLLTRVADGWHALGEVTLDSEDLAGDLEKLRAKGEAVAKGPFSSVVVLPNDQIKYLTIDTGRARDAKRRDTAIAALEEATPYRADQLSFDIHAMGRNTQIAAVARETLEEAEAFATEHAFHPIGFTAIPPSADFDAAPDFGPATHADRVAGSASHEHDPVPIRIVSSGDLPQDPAPVPPAPAPTVPPAPPVPSAPEPDAPTPDPIPEDVAQAPVSDNTAPPKAPEPPKADRQTAEPPVSFASIRARRDTPPATETKELAGARRDAGRDSVGANAPGIQGETSPTAERSLRFDPAKAVAGLKADARPSGDDVAQNAAEDENAFASRRKTSAKTPSDKRAKQPRRKQKADNEQQRLTVFGAREGQAVGGKPKYLGLVLTAVLLLFLAAVALWAAFFLEDGVAGLFGPKEDSRIVLLDPQAAIAPDAAPAPAPNATTSPSTAAPTAVVPPGPAPAQPAPLSGDVAPGVDTGDITDSAEIEAMEDFAHPTALSELEAEAQYAATGIWARAPVPPQTPTAGGTDDLYATSIDRVLIALDAVALPDPKSYLEDQPLNGQLSPVNPETRFDLDERGLVVASAQGTLNPEGVMVYLGRPPVLPPNPPNRAAPEIAALSDEETQRLASLRPRFRPENLVESNERATLGGRSRAELGRIRPKPRPTSAKEAAEADSTPTKLAITTSLRPRQRPSNIAQLAQRSKPTQAVVATPAAATIKPKIPTTASVARQATIQNALNLNKINLIGVYGTSSNRRALVRMANGRYRKVQVGDRIDGGKVAAIGDQELRYVKSGKNIVLKMPKG